MCIRDRATALPSTEFSLELEGDFEQGVDLTVTVETGRSVRRGRTVDVTALPSLSTEERMKLMDRNFAVVTDRTLSTKSFKSPSSSPKGTASVRILAPSSPGRYVIRAMAEGATDLAAGFVWLTVTSTPPRG